MWAPHRRLLGLIPPGYPDGIESVRGLGLRVNPRVRAEKG